MAYSGQNHVYKGKIYK